MTARDDSDNDLKLYHMIALVAARDGKIETLIETLNAHPQLCKRRETIELLHVACAEGRMACADALLTRGVPINEIDAQGFSAIDHAVIHHKWHCIEPLLERGANPNGSQRGSRHGKPTPLLMAAHDGQPEIMNVLIQHKDTRPHYQDSRGDNVLHHAARAKTNQKEVMAIAKSVANQPMMTHQNCEQEEPMTVAIHHHNHAAVEVLRQADVHHRRRTRGLTTGRVPIQQGLFSDKLDGGKPTQGDRGR